ncbi:MAG: hypothetical protein HUK24_01555 [Sphaerochaetaceae bacterium]|nr:hypothetical protein [Sphaerochaetaceae bacterium]
MKKYFTLILLLLLGTTMVYSITLPTVDRTFISVEDFASLLSSNDNFIVLDLRQESDYNTRHIEGAINADLTDAVNGNYNPSIEKLKAVLKQYTGNEKGQGKQLILACYTGNRYAQAATNILYYLGNDLKNVKTLQGGNTAWFSYVDGPKDISIKTKDSDYYDFSKIVGNVEFNMVEVMDIMGLSTPCAFTSVAQETGYEFDEIDRAIYKNGAKAIENKDRTAGITYPNGAKGTGTNKWPEGSALAEGLPALVDGIRFCSAAYNDDLLIICFYSITKEAYENYSNLLKTNFTRKDVTYSFSFEEKALRIDKI